MNILSADGTSICKFPTGLSDNSTINFRFFHCFQKPIFNIRSNFTRITSNGKVVGVIGRSDILKCILRLLDEDALPATSVPDNIEQR